MKKVVKRLKLLVVSLFVLTYIGCEDDDAVLPQVEAQFTQTINQNTGVVTFINASTNADSFIWNFGDGTTSTEINPIKAFANGTFTVTLVASNVAGASDTFEDQITIEMPAPTFDSGLLTNGDFSNGGDGWIGNALNVVTEGGNSFNLADIQAAGAASDVNLSQVVEITQGTNYILTFDASSDRERTILAGIGLNEDPFTNTAPSVNLTTTTQTFTLQLSATDFGSANSRVLFDMGAEIGVVVIDNVSLVEGGDGSDTNGGGGGDAPTVAAPTPPTRDAADVISLFSNAYSNITVDTFFAGFSQGGGQTDEQVAGDDVLRYADLDFAGIETINTAVDLTNMTNFSIDVWTPTSFDFIAGVVDFGGDGFGGSNPDTRGDVRETLTAGQWTTIDVTIADLQAANLTATPTDFSQLILDVVDVTGTIYVDNIYFYNDAGSGGGDAPTVAAPTPPTRDAADVISLFSNAYSNITVDTFFAGFSQGGGQTDEQVAGDDVLRYADLDFAGIETINTAVDLTNMTNFSIDVWTPTSFDFIAGVVDFGGDGFGGANPDTRGDVRETLTAGQWTTIDVTIADLQAANLTATPTDFSQLILDVVDVTGTIYVDNIYFYNDGSSSGGGDTPTVAAPTPPTRDAADVISLFSNAYSNITVDTFFAGFSQGGGQTDEQVAGDDVLRYADLDFAGIETINTAVDLTNMTNFSIDVWTPTSFDFIAGVVDFGGDGFGGANPDTRGDVRETLTAGQWTTIDVTIADLQAANLTATPTDFSQLILDVVDVTGTIYVDNIYFYNDGSSSGGGDTPTVAAPTPPTRDAADVISLFSNAYANITVDTFFAGFSQGGGQTNEQVAGDDVLRYADLDFAGIETINTAVDLTNMTNFSIDVWTPTSFDFIAGVVDFGGDGFGGSNPDTRGDVRETLTAGQWTTIDVTIADLQAANLTATPTDFSQLILDVVDVTGTIYVDNIYFYNDGSSGGGGGGGSGSADILLEEFSAATSIDSWTPVADATNATEASIAYSASEGNPDGTIQLSGTNTVDTAGRAYIFSNFFNGLDFTGATDVRLTFDVRLGAPLNAAAIQLETEIQGQGVVNTSDLQNQGINESTWTTITVDYSGLSASDNAFFRFNVNIAAGAVVGAGTTLFIDNIRLVQTN